ncbi:MAG TPA: RdgB/HAM1 family non-canonical purine NTP pyrophosphatase [Flavobacteriales bacterium]|nr:RdgB/HAM1 family non-canonical purine NTP pyrophosphatase [Flavobacteriales bacterium]
MQFFLLCTGNQGKVEELKALLPSSISVVSLAEAGLPNDLPETSATLEGNALQKARFAFERVRMPCIADDTGLEVEALNGAPGVYSARYAGEGKDPQANMAKLLNELMGKERGARFRTVLALIDEEGEHTFEGVVEGTIAQKVSGTGGFGYDPIFIPDGYSITFAEMDKNAKNAISHRGRAMAKLVEYLAQRYR